MKQQNTSGFSMIIALGLVIVMTLLVLYILQYMVPYSKNVKGVENSSKAFYQAENSIEDGLYFFKQRSSITAENSKNYAPTNPLDFDYQTESVGGIIPPVGEGDSDFDDNFNIISAGNPIQLEVGGLLGSDWSSRIRFNFRTPAIGGSRGNLSGGDAAIINWQLSSSTDSLNAQGSWILANDFSGGIFNRILFHPGASNNTGVGYEAGQTLDGTNQDFDVFYTANCTGTSNCILKMSVINELQVGTESIPYLEYRITFGTGSPLSVPLRFSRIKAKGKSYGFQKELEVKVPQQTTNEAFDFTVFQ